MTDTDALRRLLDWMATNKQGWCQSESSGSYYLRDTEGTLCINLDSSYPLTNKCIDCLIGACKRRAEAMGLRYATELRSDYDTMDEHIWVVLWDEQYSYDQVFEDPEGHFKAVSVYEADGPDEAVNWLSSLKAAAIAKGEGDDTDAN